MQHRAGLAPLIAAGLVAFLAAPAAAQSCGSEIDRLAQQYNLATGVPQSGTGTPPQPAPSGPPSGAETRTQRLAQSGGVVAPPDTGTPMAIQPPRSNPDRMATAPPVTPTPPVGSGSSAAGLSAADRSRMQALLQAAEAAERQGSEDQCLQHLREAEAVPAAPSAK